MNCRISEKQIFLTVKQQKQKFDKISSQIGTKALK